MHFVCLDSNDAVSPNEINHFQKVGEWEGRKNVGTLEERLPLAQEPALDLSSMSAGQRHRDVQLGTDLNQHNIADLGLHFTSGNT